MNFFLIYCSIGLFICLFALLRDIKEMYRIDKFIAFLIVFVSFPVLCLAIVVFVCALGVI